MLLSILERGEVLQSLMRPLVIVKIDPRLRRAQKLAQCVIRSAISYRQLEGANKAFCIAIVSGRACTAHRENKPFAQKQFTRLGSPILLALIAMPDWLSHLKREGLNRIQNQLGAHMVIEGNPQHLARAVAQGKTATHLRAIRELDLQDIGEHDLMLRKIHALFT